MSLEVNSISFFQIADASMTNVNDMLHRMRELSIQSAIEPIIAFETLRRRYE